MTAAVVLAAFIMSGAPPAGIGAAEMRARGIELGFNLDYDEAIAAFRASISADPDNLEGYRLLAAALWSRALYQQGAITTDDYTGKTGSTYRRRASNPELESAAKELLIRTEALAGRPAPDIDTRYQIGASYRFLSTLEGTISGNQWRSLGAARRAYKEHQRVLAIDPARVDAKLTVGLYRFMVSTMPTWSRIVARMAGLDSDRKEGRRLVEETAAVSGPMQSSALFALIVIHNYEERYDDTLRVIKQLQRQFPRNRLLWMEAANTELRAGRAADARISIAHGLRTLETEARPLAPGERVRWHELNTLASRRN